MNKVLHEGIGERKKAKQKRKQQNGKRRDTRKIKHARLQSRCSFSTSYIFRLNWLLLSYRKQHEQIMIPEFVLLDLLMQAISSPSFKQLFMGLHRSKILVTEAPHRWILFAEKSSIITFWFVLVVFRLLARSFLD